MFKPNRLFKNMYYGVIPIPMGNPNISKARDWVWSIFHRREIVWHIKKSTLKIQNLCSTENGSNPLEIIMQSV